MFCTIAELKNPPANAVGWRSKYWTPGFTINISFVGGTEEQRFFVQKVALKWLDYANLKFNFVSSGGMVRISFNAGLGSWSYLGTDALYVDGPTMNFGWLDEAVVLHEFGHMLGLGHEHQNPNEPIQWNREQVIADLSQAPNYWDLATIESNIFQRYPADQVDATPVDRDSVMMYYIPARWTLNGFSTGQNETISQTDAEFVREKYPFPPDEDNLAILTFLSKAFTRTDYLVMRKDTLLRVCSLVGVSTEGTKWDIVNRLISYVHEKG